MRGYMEKNKVYFNKYKIIDKLGNGGTSNVYLAENIKLGNKWAIKKTDKSNNHINLLAEPYILKDLNHPSIPKIIDIEETKNSIYIIEEYVEGITLGEYRRRRGVLSEETVINFGIELCHVLHYLHTNFNNPIIYRDLKPDNIIIMKNDRLKLIDFGIAREYKKNSERDTVILGTRGYASPEQYGISQSDERTDIFSFGVILYYLLTGKNLSTPPYKIRSITQINNNYSKELEKIILKCTETLPENRYEQVANVLEQLEDIKKSNANISNNILEYINTYGRYSITISGLTNRIGVTHTGISIGTYLASIGFKVALIEMTNSKDFTYIENMYTNIESNNNYFNIDGVDYYPNVKMKKTIMKLGCLYDYIIYDLGVINLQEVEEDFSKGDYKLLLTGGKDWEIPILENFILEKQNDEYIYLFNYISEIQFEHIKKCMENLKCNRLSYNTNPYKVNDIQRNLFEKILDIDSEQSKKITTLEKLELTIEIIKKQVISWGDNNEEKSNIIKKINSYRKSKENI
jgi:serine/threonine-protein kinase